MTKSAINSIANVLARAWGIVSTFLFIPLYIEFLGTTAFGLVSAYATLQSVFNLLGLGLSSTLRRYFALGDNSVQNRNEKQLLLRSTENIYFVVASIITLICYAGASIIATQWLNIEDLAPQLVSSVIMLMGFSISLQILANLWFGCILGLDHQVYANVCSIGWSVSKGVGSVIVCYLTKNVKAFYIWHIICDFVYCIVLRRYVKRCLNSKVRWQFKDFHNLSKIWKYTLGLLVISFVALITKQFDKILISKYLTLSELGAYNLATTLGSIPSTIAAAIAVSALTELTHQSSTENCHLLKTFDSYNSITSILVITLGVYMSVFSNEIMSIWVKDASYVGMVEKTAPLVILAITMTGLQEIPFALALAKGNTKINSFIGVCSLPMIVGTSYFFIKNWGLWGAGLAYILAMFIQTLVYVNIIYHKYARERHMIRFGKSFLLPLCISIVCALIAKALIVGISNNAWIIVGLAIVCGIVTLAGEIKFIAFNEVEHFRGKRRKLS